MLRTLLVCLKCTKFSRLSSSRNPGPAPLKQLTVIRNKGKGSPHSIARRRVPELIPVLGSQPLGDVNHKPDGRLPLLFAGPAVTLATFNEAATSFDAW